jgi:aspartate ammonia-lyase
MNQSELIKFIRKVELFRDLEDHELEIVLKKAQIKSFNPRAYLFQENSPANKFLFIIIEGEVELFKKTPFGEEKRLTFFGTYDFLGEGTIMADTPHSTNARTLKQTKVLCISKEDFTELFDQQTSIALKIFKQISKVISRRMRQSNSKVVNVGAQYESGRTRTEKDLLGYRDVPAEVYYGIQTMRGIENFTISGVTLNFYPELIISLAIVKMAAARTNHDLGLLETDITNAIVRACHEIINGKFHHHFVVDMIQGGAGTSTNMNANEVIANRALELMGFEKGEYQHCHPNNHVNLSQSTNDVYPTAVKIALIASNEKLIEVLQMLIDGFKEKEKEFANVLKMGRTQLQDAVPMTLGQSFGAYATTLEEEIERLNQNVALMKELNMGGTAIGTGINADPDYSDKVIHHLQRITGLNLTLASNLVEATQDTGAFVMYSAAVKRLAVKLSKICNDLRLMSSGPRAGLNEINLPPMQPGSSIMPGKVNPVIPEVVNQIAFKVIGNDLTVTLAAEAGQLELNVMEPIMVQSLFESIEMLKNGMNTLLHRCISGITANEEHCRQMVMNSIGLVTALNPVLGYEACTALAKEAMLKNRGVYEMVLEMGLLSKEELDEVLKPENMIRPQRIVPKNKKVD